MHPKPEPAASQFALLRQRRFAPFFWAQFAGAANDNLFKFAFTVMVTYQISVAWLPPAQAGLVIGAVFILPFLLFSATAGQIADKWEKTRLIRWMKNGEIAIMLVAAWGLVQGWAALLLACLFLMGLQSALFGPVKYAWLPQALDELHEIITYIGQFSPLAAEKLQHRIESSVLPLANFPYMFRESEKMPGFREIVADTNYLVFYRVTASRIEIVNVKHGRREFPMT